MALTPGTRLGPYEVVAQIGVGGMGEVYRATDTKLKRQVAIKVLPQSLATDAERLARFQREAEVLASLNHPNIAHIYGLEDADGTKALVMELVEGPTLDDRIAQGAIPVDEALPIAKQIAEALEAAHEQGIIHRDLKPANIKVRADGTVKVLDFGLAKAMEPPGTMSPSVSQAPTITTPAMMTGVGMILGTAAYMSPEQARGRAVDKRADIWAFGAVLFEMLTGQRAFGGDDVSEVLSRVLQREPEWTTLPSGLSPTLIVYLKRCLHRDLKQRIGDIHDVRLALEGAFETAAPQTATQAAPAPASKLPWAVAAGLAVLLVVASGALWRATQPTAAAATTRVSITVPANRPVSLEGYPKRSLAISPDGTQVVYVSTNLDAPANRPGGPGQLQLRSLASLAVRDLPGTTGANQPFFSPDGQWVAFFTSTGELKKISLAGGDPVTLAQKINGSGVSFGVWTEDNNIILGKNSVSGLLRVSAEGGEPTDLTTFDAGDELAHTFPTLVPSSRAVLFTVRTTGNAHRIESVMPDSGTRSVVLENARVPVVLSSGHLLFQRDETVLIAPFDATRLSVTGPAVPLIDRIRSDSLVSPYPAAELAVSRNGTLAYLPAADTAGALDLVGRNGAFQRLGPPPNNFARPRVSPDGRAIAYMVANGQDSEVYLYDVLRGSTTKVTQDSRDDGFAWHPDGRSLAISSTRKDAAGIFLKSLGGGERLLVPLPAGVSSIRNFSWAPDGTQLAYTVQTALQHDIWVLTMSETPTSQAFLKSAASEHSPTFSPDGRWLAYVSDESGRTEVYVQKYPQGERLAVSIDGGVDPVWRRDGKELYFQGQVDGVPKMIAVTVTPDGASLRLAKPVPLFGLRVTGPTGVVEQYARGGNGGAGYDVLPDGRFVMNRRPDPTGTREIVVVQNFFEELKRLVPTK
ncbi:MAG: protein kinase [Vicinamibacterales bacterium]